MNAIQGGLSRGLLCAVLGLRTHRQKVVGGVHGGEDLAGLLLPALPSKMTFGRSLDAIGAQRKETLHVWLSSVVAQPALMCRELRCFLGLSPRESKAASSDSERSADAVAVGMEVDEPERPSSTASGWSTSARDAEEQDGIRLLPHSSVRAQGQGEPPYAIDLKELEARAVECMLDDDLWGRR